MDVLRTSQPTCIAVAGSHGLVGSALTQTLQTHGHTVHRIGRHLEPRDVEHLADSDAIVNLAGEPILGRWTRRKKQAIYDSRVAGTRRLSEALVRLTSKPRVWINASAIGVYGHRDSDILDESSPAGDGFLADVAREWEAATQPAGEAGIRVVCLRLGVVLSRAGGALAKMVPAFKLGVGGVIGDGRQYWSWVSLDDVVGAIGFAIAHDALVGPVNVVAPDAVPQQQFAQTLGQVLGRPTRIPTPRFAVRLILGACANETLLASTRVVPRRLFEHGYTFEHGDLASALRAMTSRHRPKRPRP